jgi:hypothetical protein
LAVELRPSVQHWQKGCKKYAKSMLIALPEILIAHQEEDIDGTKKVQLAAKKMTKRV